MRGVGRFQTCLIFLFLCLDFAYLGSRKEVFGLHVLVTAIGRVVLDMNDGGLGA